MKSPKYDWFRRGIRSFVQGFIGVLAIMAVPALTSLITSVGSGGTVDLDPTFWRSVGIAAVAGGVIALVSFIQNALEDNTPFPALLKSRPSAGENPVPDGLP